MLLLQVRLLERARDTEILAGIYHIDFGDLFGLEFQRVTIIHSCTLTKLPSVNHTVFLTVVFVLIYVYCDFVFLFYR